MELEQSNSFDAEDFLASLMKFAPLGIISVDGSGRVTRANHLAKLLLQISPLNKKITGRNFSECITHIPILLDKLSIFQEKKRKSFNTEVLNLKDRFIVVKGVSIQDGFICIINEVTRLKEMETESIQSIIAGQEIERRRIAMEIHDGIGPLLSYSKLELDAFMDDPMNRSQHMDEEKLVNIRQTLDSITNDLRNLSHYLIPRLLEEFGMYSAFNNLITKLNNSIKTKVEFYSNIGPEIRFENDLELNLYRCGQELINNSVKHAAASEILVQLIKHDKSIVLMVEDDGRGFQHNKNRLEDFGIGLTNIETRVRTLNGAFILDSHEKMGTTASIEIPL